jgi:putative pyruvate formate lyase activating enzyme
MLHLQDVKKCHNINLVSPGHFVPQIIEAVNLAIPGGLHLPLVYNSNGYDDLETLKLLDGIIDIYMPDLKYSDRVMATKYSAAREYPRIARQAIGEMFKQVGLLQLDNDGIARHGLLIRHLVLPNNISGGIGVLNWIGNELSPDVTVSLMAQYYPAHYANRIPLLNRPINQTEYSEVLRYAHEHNFKHILYQ